MINLCIKEEYHKESAKHFRRHYDFFRHADRKPQDDYEFTEEWVDFLLFFSVASFQLFKQMTTEHMRTFLYWFYTKYPHWLKQENPFTQVMVEMKEMLKGVSKREYFMMRHGAEYR